jgi:hypothetical protein
MAKKRTKRITASKPGRGVAAERSNLIYQVVLRTREMNITASVQDRVLYPRAVAWNRLLTSDQGRQSSQPAASRAWQESGLQAIVELAEAGEVARSDLDAFLASAAKCGEVQVEMEWEVENVGWAARVFPWEALIALATKQARERLGGDSRGIVVVRWLRDKKPITAAATGPICFSVSAEAKQEGYATDTEFAAIEAAIAPLKLKDIPSGSLAQLSDSIKSIKPRVLHYITPSAREMKHGEMVSEGDKLEDIANAVAAHHPELVAFSSCHTGRRLAPLAVAHGAHLAVGFHDDVMDSSCPVFFGAFYREWAKTAHVLQALREGLEAHNWKKSPNELGGVTIWSATDLLSRPKGPVKAFAKATMRSSPGGKLLNKPELILEALKVTCVLEPALNYSMLHNKRGGLFAAFEVLKLKPGKVDDLEITVRIDTGLDRPVECHFFATMPDQPDRTIDFMENIAVPLGSELLRRRGEMLRGTVEVTIHCGTVRIFQSFDSIELPPCDEWKDDEAGRRFLPSFIFPRDPAVREILTGAQPFLRALKDDIRAAFDGYQSQATPNNAGQIESLLAQLRSIWGALQQNCRLDYTNPPPSYTKNVQRVRTPEEIMRSRRATCLELALLLASCWEHIGLHSVIFLSKGHAFTGYWASDQAWRDFFDTKKLLDAAKNIDPAAEGVQDKTLDAIDPAKASGGGMVARDPDWFLRATHHLALISREIKAVRLVAVEATSVARLEAFGDAVKLGREQLADAFAAGTFDGMIDVRTARDQRVTPLAIITDGIVA